MRQRYTNTAKLTRNTTKQIYKSKDTFSELNSTLEVVLERTRNSYTMGCPSVRGDNPRALASGLSYVQVDKHGLTILYHLHQCRPCISRDSSCLSW